MLLLLELVKNKLLEGLREGGSSKLAVTYFLGQVSCNSTLSTLRTRRTLTLPDMSFLTGLNAADPRRSTEC